MAVEVVGAAREVPGSAGSEGSADRYHQVRTSKSHTWDLASDGSPADSPVWEEEAGEEAEEEAEEEAGYRSRSEADKSAEAEAEAGAEAEGESPGPGWGSRRKGPAGPAVAANRR